MQSVKSITRESQGENLQGDRGRIRKDNVGMSWGGQRGDVRIMEISNRSPHEFSHENSHESHTNLT